MTEITSRLSIALADRDKIERRSGEDTEAAAALTTEANPGMSTLIPRTR